MSLSDLHYIKRTSSLDETQDKVANNIISILKSTETGEIQVTLAVAELLTGSSLIALLTSVKGAKDFFCRGIVTYTTLPLYSLLNVDAELIIDHGVADGDVAKQMAVGIRNHTTVHGIPTTWGISTTGVAGPDIQGDKPIGTVFIGISSEEHSKVFGLYHFSGNRKEICRAAVVEALALLRQMLVGAFYLALAIEEQTLVDFQIAPGILKSSSKTECAFKIVNGFNLELG
jgi:nicotinamide-nucleotide amidase